MNFVDKFDGSLPSLDAHARGSVHIDSVSTHAPPGSIIVEDGQFLFTADFKRSGVDLVLSKDDRELVLHDYFKSEKHAPLASPDGAHLTGDLVNALTGYTQYAQAGTPEPPKVIGHVTKLTGNATAIRNGVAVVLNQGDNVYKGDVVQAGSDSALGLTFIDGTVFGLGANAKMVLNEMIYDPNGSSNTSLMSLVQGTISFVAGQTAKHGDMKVDTPVATMGIRGTAVLVEIDFDVQGTGGVPPAKFQVLVEPDGSTGSYILFDKTTLNPIATVDQAGTQTIVNGQGTVSFLSSAQLSAEAQKIISDVFSLKFTDNSNNPNTKLTINFTDSVIPFTTGLKFGSDSIVVTQFLLNLVNTSTIQGPLVPGNSHVAGAPSVATSSSGFTEQAGQTHSGSPDTVSGQIRWVDINLGDIPTATASFTSFSYHDAANQDVSASLTAAQKAAIAAVEVPLQVSQNAGNSNIGSATWTYSLADGAFDFLAAGETLTLTYTARVDNNYQLLNEAGFQTFTITITGTNDTPVVTSSAQAGAITELPNTLHSSAPDKATGTITFSDADLTDTHTVSITDVSVSGVATGLANKATVLGWLSLGSLTDSTDGVTGSRGWTFSAADNNFDYLAVGETLTLTYTIQIDDGHGGVVTLPVTITVTGSEDKPVITSPTQAAAILEGRDLTGSERADDAAGTVTFTDVDLSDTHNVTIAGVTAHGVTTGLADQATVLSWFTLHAFTDSTGGVTGSRGWIFSAEDKSFDYLAAGETLTLTYLVQVDDHHGGVVTQPVTITVTGTNDTPVIAADVSGVEGSTLHPITEHAGVTGDPANDTAGGTLLFKDVDLSDTHTTSQSAPSFVWADGKGHALTLDDTQIAALTADSTLALTLHDSTGTGAGSVDFDYSAADASFDFLAAGETLTITYNVTVTDEHGATSTQPVTITVTGTNDAPVLSADVSGPHVIPEIAGQTGDSTDLDAAHGTLAFTDVDLDDTHTTSQSAPSFAWTDGDGHALTLTDAQKETLTANSTLALTLHDSTGTGAGSVDFNYSAADASFDFLSAGETLTITYNVTVTDEHGATSTQPVTITVTGTNDAPVLSADASGPHVIPEIAGQTGDTTDLDAAHGTLAFTDVDLDDTHTTSQSAPSFAWTDGDGHTLTLTDAQKETLTADSTLALTLHDSTGTGAGSIDFNYSAADASFDFLSAGETLTITYDVTVTDEDGSTSTQPVTITITGTNDAPVLSADASGPHTIAEIAGQTGDTTDLDAAHGTLAFSDVDLDDTHTTSQSAPSFAWTDGDGHALTLTDAQKETLTADSTLALTLHDSTGTGAGSVDFDYSAADASFDFLAAGETLTITYNVTVTDEHGVASTQPVTITVTGTNDVPVLSADASGPHTIAEIAGQTGDTTDLDAAHGTLAFTDVDLDDTHTTSQSAPSFVWADGKGHALTLSSAQIETLTADSTLALTLHDSTGKGAGSVDFNYSAADASFDFLSAGETLTITYNVTVTDEHGATSTQPVTITVTGTNDAPVLSADASGPHTIAEIAGQTGDTTDLDAAHGTLAFSDVDLDDTHTTSQSAPSFAWADAQGDPLTLTDAQKETLTADSTLALTLHDSTGTGAGSVDFDYSAADASFDFLSAGETLTITYNVTVTDEHGVASTQPVTITVTGTNDAPVITSAAQTASISDIAHTTGSLTPDTASGAITFTDADLSDTHGVTVTGVAESGTTSGLPDATTVQSWLTLGKLTDSTGGGTGSDTWTFSAADKTFDYLAAGQAVTLTYTVAVDDHHGGVTDQTVAITVTGTDKSPTMTFTTLDASGDSSSNSQATGINDAGTVVGQADPTGTHQVGWSYDGSTFSTIVAPNGDSSAQDTSAHAINNSGVIAGDFSPERSTPRYGFTDDHGSFSTIASDSPYPSTNANGINDAGVVVGSDYLHAGARYTGYIETNGSLTYFNAPGTDNPSGDTFANGINNHGVIVGSYNPDYSVAADYKGFVYDGETFTTIADPLGVNGTYAQGINDAGEIVGYYVDASNEKHGFIDDGGVFTTIDDALGVNGTVINGINNAGAVVGYYVDADNATHGFVANPTLTITVQTSDGLDFQSNSPLKEMGEGAVQPSGSSTTYTVVDAATNHEFVVDGTGFTYNADGTLTGGIITSFHEFETGDTLLALADFTGLSVYAPSWMSAVQQYAAGDKTAAEALTGNYSYVFNGGTGNDNFGSAGHADTLAGTGQDIFDGGGAPTGSHDTETGGAGSTFTFGLGYGALTITNFDQAHGTFDPNDADQIQLNGLSTPLNVSYSDDGNTILDFGNGDVITLLHVTQAQYEGLSGSEFTSGGNNNGGGNNGGGPVVSGADNTVSYLGTPVLIDPSVTVTDDTGTVTSVNVWISSGFQDGDTLSIAGQLDGDLYNPDDGSTIHYHYDNTAHGIYLATTSGTATLDDFNNALHQIQFSNAGSDPSVGSTDTTRTVTWAAHDDADASSPTATTTINVDDAPVIHVDNISATQSSDGTTTVTGLSVTDSDASADETFTLTATTAGAGSTVNPASPSGHLSDINAALQTGLTYDEGETPPATDEVTVTVADGHGATDKVNLIFNVQQNPPQPVTLTGTSDKDVFFGTDYQDKFVFAPNFNHDTILNFTPGQDQIDLSSVVATGTFSSWFNAHVATSPTNSADTLITVDAADTITLHNVSKANLAQNDFILHYT